MNREEILAQLETVLKTILQLPEDEKVDFDVPLSDYGLDSMLKVDLALAVQETFKYKIPATEIDVQLESLSVLANHIEEDQNS